MCQGFGGLQIMSLYTGSHHHCSMLGSNFRRPKLMSLLSEPKLYTVFDVLCWTAELHCNVCCFTPSSPNFSHQLPLLCRHSMMKHTAMFTSLGGLLWRHTKRDRIQEVFFSGFNLVTWSLRCIGGDPLPKQTMSFSHWFQLMAVQHERVQTTCCRCWRCLYLFVITYWHYQH